MDRYYLGLGGALLRMKGLHFWKYHREIMHDLGHPIKWGRVMKGAVDKVMEKVRRAHA